MGCFRSLYAPGSNFSSQTPIYNEVTVKCLGLFVGAALLTPAHSAVQTSMTRVVLAVAADPRGRPLVDVGADDFVVSEGGSPREVLSVRVADYPIVVAVDTRAASHVDLPAIKQAARHFIERLGADRPVIVSTLGRAPRAIATFDDPRAAVLARLDALSPDESGDARLLTGLGAAIETLRVAQPLFSAIVMLASADGDIGVAADDDPVASIVRSGAALHAIVKQGSSAAGAAQLRDFVTQARGDVATIYAAASYQAALDRLADRLSSELLIEYISPAGGRAEDVKVGIRVPGARVRGLGVAPR